MNSLGITVFWCVAQVTLLTFVAGVLYCAGRRLGPSTGAFVSLAALLLVTVITVFSFSSWPNWLSVVESRLSRSPSVDSPTVAAGDKNEPALNSANSESEVHPDIATESPLRPMMQAFLEGIQHPRSEAVASSNSLNWAGLVALVVLAGVSIGSVRLVMGLLSVRRYRRDSQPIEDASVLELVDILAAELRCTRTIEVRESQLVPGAATIGWRRPLILLPPSWRSWNESDRHAVLAHELAHIHHADYLTWLMAQIGLVLHFYHPLAHWLCRCLRLDQELIADSAAARLVGGRQPYLQSLAKIALQQSEVPLSWPARTFLPTRRTFLRRIEMLRDSKEKWLAPAPQSARWLAAIVLVATGLAALGLRGPGGSESGMALAQQPAAARKTNVEPLGLAYVPRDSVLVVGVRPATLLQRPPLQALAAGIQKLGDLEKALGVSPADVETFQFVALPPIFEQGGPPPIATIIRLKNADAAKKLAGSLAPQAKKDVYGTQEFFRQDPNVFYFLPDERTIVYSNNNGVLNRCMVAGPTGASTAKWANDWKGVAGNDVAAVLNTASLRAFLTQLQSKQPEAAQMSLAAYSPLWEKSEVAVLGIQVTDSLTLHASSTSNNNDDAVRVRDTLSAVVTMARNSLSQVRQVASTSRSPDGPLMLGSLDIADELLEALKIGQAKNQVTVDVKVTTANTVRLVQTLIPGVTSAREAAQRQQSANNLKQIALAFHNFYSANNRFPPAVVLGPNEVPRSWRIELLPYLDANKLYEQYRKDEPWDSDHNKLILSQMPAVFRNPKDDPTSTKTSYFVITGPGTLFDGPEGTTFAEITDGTSNTLLAIESNRDIPWTKPEDIPYAADKPLPKFGGWQKGGFSAAIADGSVRFLADALDQNVLRLLITANDGQPIPGF